MYDLSNRKTSGIRFFILFITFGLNSFSLFSEPEVYNPVVKDSISIYSGKYQPHDQFYNWMWGEHYRSLYYMKVDVEKINLKEWSGGLNFVEYMSNLYGMLFKDNHRRYYLFKTLGTPTSFIESSFFKDIYNYHTYKDTYLGNFIKEGATIENPFGFIISDNLALKVGLNTGKINVFQILDNHADTISDSTLMNNKLTSVYRLPDLDSLRIITKIDTLLNNIHKNKGFLDQDLYIRTRLYDMLIGDWNKIPENWGWLVSKDSLDNAFKPMVLDRSHAFTKVDGVFFKRLLGMLGLSFITNYDGKEPDVATINKLGYTLDMALTANSKERDWVQQSYVIQSVLTDSLLDTTYDNLPKELQIEDFRFIIETIKRRRDFLDKLAVKYFYYLQKKPILAVIDKNISIQNLSDKQLLITFSDKNTGEQEFHQVYNTDRTKEIWLYALNGNNNIDINKSSSKIPVLLIDEEGTNQYNIRAGKGLKIYAPSSEKGKLDSLRNVKTIFVDDQNDLAYNYKKYKYADFSFTPIGAYDSDLGLNFGTSVSYTKYGFRRDPFTSQHQLSYNYSSGLSYQGIFPIFDTKADFHLFAFMRNSASFYNYFGMGNMTDSFSDKNKKYNRVHYQKYLISPSIDYAIDKSQNINVGASFELLKLKNPVARNRYINTLYQDDSDMFKMQKYIELDIEYHFDKEISSFLSDLSVDFNSGWIVNLNSIRKNVPYTTLKIALDLSLTDRLTLATMLKGKALFSNSYQFYQAATTELRGFRSNRFLGKQSFYECTDLRLDMGRLENPLTPTSYGLFVGVDHGRVWYSKEKSDRWHTSYGGGFWLTVFKQVTGKFSYFASNEHENRFMFELGLSF